MKPDPIASPVYRGGRFAHLIIDGKRFTAEQVRAACLALPQSEEPPEPASADRVRVTEALAQTAWAIRQWKDKMTPEELAQAIFDAPARAALSATPEQGRVEERNPDYVYDKSDWEWTSTWVDRDTLTDGMDVGEITHVGTLYSGPDKWACRIDETEVRWFDTREEAEAAIAPRATTDHEGEATP